MYFHGLTEKERSFILKELKENKAQLEKDLQYIKQWLSQQPHLPDAIDEDVLKCYLRDCKYSLDKTKKKLDTLFTVRTALPEYFNDRDSYGNQMENIMDVGYFVPLPKLTPEGYRVLFLGLTDYDEDKYDLGSIAKSILLCNDILYLRDNLTTGQVLVINAAGFTWKHFLRSSLAEKKKVFYAIQEAYPFRMKEVHIVNAPPIAEKIFGMIKQFITEKIRNRIHIHHDDFRAVKNSVPVDMLPSEFGGKGESVHVLVGKWREEINRHRKWILEQAAQKSNELRRPGKPLTHSDLFGIEGSFRQLEVD